MSSTNKTSHYNLSQYVGTDKPTYLADYNSDMSNIDTGIYGAKTIADTNTNSIGTLSSLTTDTKSNLVGAINEVDSHADTNAGNISTNTTNIASNTSHIGVMANLETTEKSNLVGAVNELKSLIENFNLSIFETPTNPASSVGSPTYTNLSVAKNTDGSLAKVYGAINIGNISNQAEVEITFTTSLRPETAITINSIVYARQYGYNTDIVGLMRDLTIGTNGVVTINIPLYSTSTVCEVSIIPCLLFIKDFGDVPTPTN